MHPTNLAYNPVNLNAIFLNWKTALMSISSYMSEYLTITGELSNFLKLYTDFTTLEETYLKTKDFQQVKNLEIVIHNKLEEMVAIRDQFQRNDPNRPAYSNIWEIMNIVIDLADKSDHIFTYNKNIDIESANPPEMLSKIGAYISGLKNMVNDNRTEMTRDYVAYAMISYVITKDVPQEFVTIMNRLLGQGPQAITAAYAGDYNEVGFEIQDVLTPEMLRNARKMALNAVKGMLEAHAEGITGLGIQDGNGQASASRVTITYPQDEAHSTTTESGLAWFDTNINKAMKLLNELNQSALKAKDDEIATLMERNQKLEGEVNDLRSNAITTAEQNQTLTNHVQRINELNEELNKEKEFINSLMSLVGIPSNLDRSVQLTRFKKIVTDMISLLNYNAPKMGDGGSQGQRVQGKRSNVPQNSDLGEHLRKILDGLKKILGDGVTNRFLKGGDLKDIDDIGPLVKKHSDVTALLKAMFGDSWATVPLGPSNKDVWDAFKKAMASSAPRSTEKGKLEDAMENSTNFGNALREGLKGGDPVSILELTETLTSIFKRYGGTAQSSLANLKRLSETAKSEWTDDKKNTSDILFAIVQMFKDLKALSVNTRTPDDVKKFFSDVLERARLVFPENPDQFDKKIIRGEIVPLVQKREDVERLLGFIFGKDWANGISASPLVREKAWSNIKTSTGKPTVEAALEYASGLSSGLKALNDDKPVKSEDFIRKMDDIQKSYGVTGEKNITKTLEKLTELENKVVGNDRTDGDMLFFLQKMAEFVGTLHTNGLSYNDAGKVFTAMKEALVKVYAAIENIGERDAQNRGLEEITNYLKGENAAALLKIDKTKVPGHAFFFDEEIRLKLVEIETAFLAYQNAFRQMTNRLSGIAITRASAADLD
jgi:hypothetical protein